MKSNFNKYPSLSLRKTAEECSMGWEDIAARLKASLYRDGNGKSILVVDCYQGTNEEEILESLTKHLIPDYIFLSSDSMLSEKELFRG